MENQDEKFYRNLPRKELQGLCKKHGLSANKTNFLLARSLFSFFKERDMSSTPSNERLSCPVEVSMSHLQPEEPLDSLEETDKVHKKRVETSDADSYGPSFKEKEGHDISHFQTVEQKEINHPEADTSNKVAKTAANAACMGSANIETTEGFSCSTSNHRNIIQKVAPSHLQEIIPNSLNLRNSDLHLQNPPSKGCMPQIQCRNRIIGACPAESGLVSSSENSMELCPASFQFFVRSEEGINLYVDLNSGPSDWIKVLKDEVCIYQKVHDNKSRVLHEELRGLGDSSKRTKTSFIGYLETGFKNRGDERNNDFRYIRSSTSSFERANCHSGPSHQVLANKVLRCSELTSNSIPGEVRRHLEEDGQVVSSVCKCDSGLQNQMGSSNLSCPNHSKTVPQNSLVAASKKDGSSISVSDNSLNKCAHAMDVNLNVDGANCSDLLEFPTLKTASVSQLVNEGSEKNSLTLSSKISEDSSLPDIIHHKSHTGIGQGSQGSGNMEMQLSGVQVHHENEDTSTLPHQFDCPLRVDLTTNGVQSERSRLLDHQLDQETCNRNDNPAGGDLTHAFPGKQGRNTAAIVEESSEYSQFDNSSETTNKRSRILELPEESQRNSPKNQHNGHAKPMEKNLARELLLPRRSKRLVSKVQRILKRFIHDRCSTVISAST